MNFGRWIEGKCLLSKVRMLAICHVAALLATKGQVALDGVATIA